jgi:hypothetical protein
MRKESKGSASVCTITHYATICERQEVDAIHTTTPVIVHSSCVTLETHSTLIPAPLLQKLAPTSEHAVLSSFSFHAFVVNVGLPLFQLTVVF